MKEINEFRDEVGDFDYAVTLLKSHVKWWNNDHYKAKSDYTKAKTSADNLINFTLKEYKSGKITKNEYDEAIRGIDKLYSLNEKKKKKDWYESYGNGYEKWRDISINTIMEQKSVLNQIADDLVSAQYEIRNMATQTKIMYDRRENLETIKWLIYYYRNHTSSFLSYIEEIWVRYI